MWKRKEANSLRLIRSLRIDVHHWTLQEGSIAVPYQLSRRRGPRSRETSRLVFREVVSLRGWYHLGLFQWQAKGEITFFSFRKGPCERWIFSTHLILLHSGQNRKNLRNREKKRFWDNVLVSCKQFSTLPALLQMSGSCPKPERKNKKTSRNRKILSKTKRILEKSIKTIFWDNVLVSCKQSVGQIVSKSFDFSMSF